MLANEQARRDRVGPCRIQTVACSFLAHVPEWIYVRPYRRSF